MTQLQPMPLFINEPAGADRGLICGYQLQPHGPAREVNADGIVHALAQPDQVTWLHFNLSDARAPSCCRKSWHRGSRRTPGETMVLLLILASGGATLAVLFWRRML